MNENRDVSTYDIAGIECTLGIVTIIIVVFQPFIENGIIPDDTFK